MDKTVNEHFGETRKMKGYHSIQADYKLLSTLHEILTDYYDRWGDMTEDEVFREMMKRGKGHFNPVTVIQLITSYRGDY